MQRTAAARMFIRDAELLVFDDLSSGLDVETEQTLWERLFETRQTTCLVVSHRRPALRRADQIVVLKEGRGCSSRNLGRTARHLRRDAQIVGRQLITYLHTPPITGLDTHPEICYT